MLRRGHRPNTTKKQGKQGFKVGLPRGSPREGTRPTTASSAKRKCSAGRRLREKWVVPFLLAHRCQRAVARHQDRGVGQPENFVFHIGMQSLVGDNGPSHRAGENGVTDYP